MSITKKRLYAYLSPIPKGQLYTVIRLLRGYYDYTDSDRATTPGSLLGFGHQLSLEPLAPNLFSRVWILLKCVPTAGLYLL